MYRAAARPSRPPSPAARAANARLFEELMATAERPQAGALGALRAIPEYEPDQRVLAAWQRLGPFVRTGPRSAWTARTLAGEHMHTAPIMSVAPGPSCAVTGSLDGTARIWHAGGVHVLAGHGRKVRAVALLRRVRHRLPRLCRARPDTAPLGVRVRPVRAAAGRPAGRRQRRAGHRHGAAHLLHSGRFAAAHAARPRPKVQDVALLPGDWRAISGGLDGQARIWHLDWDLTRGPARP